MRSRPACRRASRSSPPTTARCSVATSSSSGYALSLGDGGAGTLRFYQRGAGTNINVDTASVITNDTWYFVAAVVDTTSWQRPAVFDWLQEKGDVEQDEMWRVFNCGVGFIAIVPRLEADAALASLKKSKVKAFVMGEIVKGKQDVRFV